jgi:hypothetical protein
VRRATRGASQSIEIWLGCALQRCTLLLRLLLCCCLCRCAASSQPHVLSDRHSSAMMSFPRALFVALMTLLAMAAMTTMTAAVPTQEDEATKTEREANATREELLKRYVHQTGEGDCSVEHCNACKVESDCKAIHACMWSGDECVPPPGCQTQRRPSPPLSLPPPPPRPAPVFLPRHGSH